MRRRDYLVSVAVASIDGSAGCVRSVPVVGSVASGCGPGDVEVESIRNGGYTGERVTVTGELDYVHTVGGEGIVGFRIDGKTGTISVFLETPRGRNLDFGDCLTVRGTVKAEDDRPGTDGPVIVGETLE